MRPGIPGCRESGFRKVSGGETGGFEGKALKGMNPMNVAGMKQGLARHREEQGPEALKKRKRETETGKRQFPGEWLPDTG